MTPTKRTRVEGTIVKHAPIKLVGKSSQDCFYVSSKMPFVSALKKVTKLLKPSRKQPKRQYIKMMGMGKCVDKTVSLGLRFQQEGYKVEIYTGQTTLFDEIKVSEQSEEKMDVDGDESDSDEEVVKQQRVISTIEVRVYSRD
ncbi:Ribonucleases P/MRP protein subunit POP7 [Yarrowia sp. E02]|nr:Ribonucleases P/MRP protein subunit POP7 [Yarrowia sp. E02]